MQAEDQLRAGRVQEALQTLQEQVRQQPGDVQLRVFLFQLLSVLGQWDRVLTQLKVLGDLDHQALLVSRVYEHVVRAELLRREIFVGKSSPVIFGEPEPWMASLLHGNELAARGDFTAAQECLQEALDAAPGTPGSVNSTPCQWMADADLRLGPMLEVVIGKKYFWVPFFRIKEWRLQPPKHIRDLIWLPVEFVWTNGGQAAGFIFVRYPGTEAAEDGELRLARKTDWHQKAEGLSFGAGQRMVATDGQDFAILDIRSVDFAPTVAAAPNST
ncbi:MAG TPA: type VI secretion system accessory protein TagJ [Verrucomicrobiae bacterium]|jgi:type VI secretion system protein ImpE